MGISMYEASVGVFIPFLDNLSGLLDHADAYADSRNIDSAILLGMRLHPGMYNLAQQVGEANRHAVIACALLSGHVPLTVPTAEPDLAELKRRITAACEFLRGLPRGGGRRRR